MKIGSLLYDINEVSISQAVDFVIDEPNLMPSGYSFVSHTFDRKTIFFAGFDRSYDQIQIELNIKRRSSYFIRLISWPGSILILLTLAIFFLPPTASERILYGKKTRIPFIHRSFLNQFQVEYYSFVNSFSWLCSLYRFPNNLLRNGHGWDERFSMISV